MEKINGETTVKRFKTNYSDGTFFNLLMMNAIFVLHVCLGECAHLVSPGFKKQKQETACDSIWKLTYVPDRIHLTDFFLQFPAQNGTEAECKMTVNYHSGEAAEVVWCI